MAVRSAIWRFRNGSAAVTVADKPSAGWCVGPADGMAIQEEPSRMTNRHFHVTFQYCVAANPDSVGWYFTNMGTRGTRSSATTSEHRRKREYIDG